MLIEVDVETRRLVDLVPDREADTRAAWLAQPPGIEIVCRDRASFFAEGATRGAPQALQVADRWHLWHNLGEAADKCVYRHRGCLRPTPAHPEELHDPQHDLALSRAVTTEETFSGQWQSRAHARRLQALPRSALAGRLHQRLETVGGDQGTGYCPRGYAGVRAYVSRTLRGKSQPVGPRPPSARAAARWILTHPDALPAGDRLQLKAVLANYAELTALAEHVRPFGYMVAHLQGDQLPTWIEAATSATELPSLRSFAQHVERDLDAVTAGLTLPWNSGVVEGHAIRIKMLRPQMFGREGFDLLRKRLLLA
ncbi:transposase [Streptomyces sp. NPDC101234]|uniref:transposase n=1 Tax=Streptomyces sp. NPDC101234 TaxID=3366138 RepID=UPI0038157D6D